VLQNRVITRIFGSKVYKGPQGWIKVKNEELRDLYSSRNIIKVIKIKEGEMCGACGGAHGTQAALF